MRPVDRAFLAFLFLLPFRAAEPVAVEILFNGVSAPGGGWVLTVTVEAAVDLADLDIRLESSPGLTLGAGEPAWRGPLEAGEAVILETAYNLTAPPPQRVTIRIGGETAAGLPFDKTAVRRIEPAGE